MKKLCDECDKRNTCTTPCQAVRDILWKDNRVMERHYEDKIVTYPQAREIRFSELDIEGIFDADDFSMHDVIPWSSEDRRLMKSKVFIERFFNKVPCAELAEKYGVKENTIVCMYRDAVETIGKVVDAMDARREGLKATKRSRFSDDEKFFLLVEVFGFSGVEVARMFKREHKRVCLIVKRMADRYQAFFTGETDADELPVVDPPMPSKLSRPELVQMVEAYTEQGLSHAQAFSRIAKRQAETVGRPVKTRAIESRYRKALKSPRVNG